MTLATLWSIFWRTFAALSLAVFLTIQVPELVDETWVKNTANAVGLGLVAALIGAVVAAGWAYVRSPAVTAVEKGLRAAVEKVIGGLGVLVIDTWAELVSTPKIILGTLIAAAVSFVVTYFQYLGDVPAQPAVVEPVTGHQS